MTTVSDREARKARKLAEEEANRQKAHLKREIMKAEQEAQQIRTVEAIRREIERFRQVGGPTAYDLECVTSWGRDMAEEDGEYAVLPYSSMKTKADREREAHVERKIARAVAVLAFLPGGIELFGEHFDGRAGA